MANKPIGLTAHAKVRLRDRGIDPKWIREAILEPDWTEVDPKDPAIERRFRAVPEFGGRILRVACSETNSSIRVISAMLDRNARQKP